MTRRSRWHRVRRWAFAALLLAAAVLLVRYARGIDWPQVGAALAGYAPSTLLSAAALAALSYLLYGSYDLVARVHAGHALPAGKVLAIAFTCYAFGLNIGALVGSTGLRYRLYSHAGLGAGCITRIVVFSTATNWLGYLMLAGALLAMGAIAPPPHWGPAGASLRWLGAGMFAAAAGYLLACRFGHGRMFHLRSHHFRLPPPSLGALQLLLAGTNWALAGAVLHVLMPPAIGYFDALGALLMSALATLIVRIPAGLGVLEAVTLAALGHLESTPRLLAAVLAFRACYYLLPLLAGLVLYTVLETRALRAVRES
ncbi:lysylphosphatidylglycerol synthase transmembrane domain-containing protein [Marilutibacter chinensis]|uniref:UPF0104 family protein n=1 Tax=Marilutibacter chinensis TaxID=2912247 RepID=A0ABS9HXQ8_9GAMM|nr:YbhN family protein [Lysobacter chinensis]MCF7223128.1 UPF0104 family protein [Lysobacter chinensis]